MPGRVVGGGIAAQCAGALGVRVDGTRMLGLLGRVVMVAPSDAFVPISNFLQNFLQMTSQCVGYLFPECFLCHWLDCEEMYDWLACSFGLLGLL
jgi:hypothetical protein